ncbi:MAG TPA: ABC transporter permease [Candidatus Coprenecus pullistercoris]|nr:ABC transporter permease [Candidatus Coprenecus pullistercoris]
MWRRIAEQADTAWRSVRTNRLRTSLTIAVIALGITSLVGILTAVDAMNATLEDAYGRLGAGSLSLRSSETIAADRVRRRGPKEITMRQAELFSRYLGTPASVTLYASVAEHARVEADAAVTLPTVRVLAVDESYMDFHRIGVEEGRALLGEDVASGRPCCVIGRNVAVDLFGNHSPAGCRVKVCGAFYTVAGVAEKTGSTADGGMDDAVLVPYTCPPAVMTDGVPDFTIGVLPDAGIDRETAMNEVRNVMRAVRRLSPADEDDFLIVRNETVMQELDSVMGTLTAAAVVIGLITIAGAAVSLMNIMLVSVKERTVEIGTRKALGASASAIRTQFLVEAVLICEAGGVAGILTGLAAGNITAAVMEAVFVIPWGWMLSAVLLCMAVGLLSGYLPASRASALDAVICLRHE